MLTSLLYIYIAITSNKKSADEGALELSNVKQRCVTTRSSSEFWHWPT